MIAELTLFFKTEDLDLSMTTSLTIMLVMYTMYQSVSLSLPQTAYIKFIDIWIIFCLIVPFFVFVIHFFAKINKQKNNLKIRSEKSGHRKKHNRHHNQHRFDRDKEHGSTHSRCCRLIIVAVPIATFLFILFYIVAAVLFYCNPWCLIYHKSQWSQKLLKVFQL